MQKQACSGVLLALLGVLFFMATPSDGFARTNQLDNVKVTSCPSLLLKHWKASSESEKMAFLFGVVTMIEVEKEWQGKNRLPVSQSTIGTWVSGLSGASLGDIRVALDQYAANNPSADDMHVMEALGRIYVRPSLSPADLKAASARYKELQRK